MDSPRFSNLDRIGPFGAGSVLFMGTSGAVIAVSTTAVQAEGLPLLATLVVLSSRIQFAFSARLSLLRRIITPTVGGTVIMLIPVNIFPFMLSPARAEIRAKATRISARPGTLRVGGLPCTHCVALSYSASPSAWLRQRSNSG